MLDSNNKELSPKKKASEIDKEFKRIFNNRLVNDIKNEFGKNTKTKEDFSNYLNKNYIGLAQAFLTQKSGLKGRGISKQWAMNPPTKQEFIDYFEGKDVKKNTRSDRKAALAEAVSNQIAIDARNEFLDANPDLRKAFNERNKIQLKVNRSNKAQEEASKVINETLIADKNEVESMKTLGGGFKSFLNDLKQYKTVKDASQKELIENPQWVKAGVSRGDNIYFEENVDVMKNDLSSVVSSIPKELVDLFGLDSFAFLGQANRALDPASTTLASRLEGGKGSPKWLIKKDGKAERILPGTPGVGFEYFKNAKESAKDIEELYKNKDIDLKLYRQFKNINLNNVEFQNLTNPGKNNFLNVLQRIASDKKYNTVKQRIQALNDAGWNKKSIDALNKANNDLMKFQIDLLKNQYEKGKISKDALFTMLQWQTNIKNGFRGLTSVNSFYLQNGPVKLTKGEHSKPNALTMVQIYNYVTGTKKSRTLNDIVSQHTQDFGTKENFNLIDNVFGSTTAMEGNQRLLQGLSPTESASFYDISGQSILSKNLEKSFKENGVPIDVGFAQLQQEYKINGPISVQVENRLNEVNINKFNEVSRQAKEAKTNLSNTELAEGVLGVLKNSWGGDINIITDKKAAIDFLIKNNNMTPVQARSYVGKASGFRAGSTIFVGSSSDMLNTAIHESGHIWNPIIKEQAPELWNDMVKKVKDSNLWEATVAAIKNEPEAYPPDQYTDDSFDLEDEVLSILIGNRGETLVEEKNLDKSAFRKFIDSFWKNLRNILGFDPTTKNFQDLTMNEVLDLAVSEIMTGNPLSNFSKLKDVNIPKKTLRTLQESKNPSMRAVRDPEYKALKQLQKDYKENGRDLALAIETSYSNVKDILSFDDWSDLVSSTVKEIKIGKTAESTVVAVAKKDVVNNEKNRKNLINTIKKLNAFIEGDEYLPTEILNKKINDIQDIALKNQKEIAEKQAEGLNKNFRKIINSVTGKLGKPSRWFIPPNAEDIKGLLYTFLPGGKEGVEAKKFFNSTILDPYSRGVADSEAEILQKTRQFTELMENFKSDLKEVIDVTPYSAGQAIKVYNWIKNGVDVDIEKQSYKDALVEAVETNPELKALADQIEQNFPIEYKATWRNDTTINKSIYDAINSGTRTKHLATFAENVDNIFNKDNLQEIENLYGKKFRQALQNSLQRMKTGRNRVSTDAQSNAFLNWINRAVATTMFVNTRSAVLQLLSSLNFIGKPNNNIFQATAAMFSDNWKKDFNTLWNSDYLKNRRDGAKFDVLADEMSEGDVKGLNKILKFGFLPTRMADSFAIALGGAAYYRNTMDALISKGMSQADAKKEAMRMWQTTAEESQQSSDPSKISEIQSSSIGKVIYAFANTPFQYARISKRKLQDVVSGRSAAEGGGNQIRKDLQSVLYYTVGQAMVFNALQTALFAAAFEDDEDEKEKLVDEKTILSVERALTSYAKSLGNPGAVVGAIYNVIAEASEQQEKFGFIDNPYKVALEATSISPPLNTKLRDIVAIGNIYKYNEKEIKNDPFKLSPDNKALEIVGNAASFGGIPLDRVIRKTQNLAAIANEEADAWQKLFLALGWSKWELGLQNNKPTGFGTDFNTDFDTDFSTDFNTDFSTPFNKTVLNKSLPKDVLGRANNDGTIEVDPSLKGKEKKKVIAHEKKHMQDMKSGKLNYDDNFVYYNGDKHERKNGKINYNGKKYIEGHPKLPWEAAANKVERQTT